jgi:hypothetical protein
MTVTENVPRRPQGRALTMHRPQAVFTMSTRPIPLATLWVWTCPTPFAEVLRSSSA